MPHVVIISKTFVAATAQRQLEWLTRQPGIALTLITPPHWRADDGGVQTFTPTFTEGYRVITAPIVANGRYHFYHFPHIGRLLDTVRPDLVHIDDEPYNTATCHALWHCQRRGIPALAVTWQNIARRYPPPFALMEQWVYRHAAAIIAGNGDAAAVVRAKGYCGPLHTFSLHGIDPDLWPPRPATPPGLTDPFTIGYVGRLVPEKGIAVLLRALVDLPPRCQAQIIGRGPDEARLRAFAAELGLDARVTWQPYIPAQELPLAMRALDALVLPSLTRSNWREQFGRVLVEAMAAGVPVVGAASGEIARVIGDAGTVCPEDDAPALGAALTRLATDPDWWQRCALAGRARALTHFTQEAIAIRLAEVYETIIAPVAAPR